MTCEDRVAMVRSTGESGMGRSIALTLAREGASVVVNYFTNSDSAASVVAHIEKDGGRGPGYFLWVSIYVALTGLEENIGDIIPRTSLCLPWAVLFCPFRAEDGFAIVALRFASCAALAGMTGRDCRVAAFLQ